MKIRKENNKKNTKKALALSVLSGALCFAMLAGSTYAWFSDSASAQNIISTGNLDVELKHLTDAGVAAIDENTKLFLNANGGDILWEPGVMATETFVVENAGSLNLVYDLALNSTEAGVGEEGSKDYLKNYLQVAMLPATVAEDGTVTPASVTRDGEIEWDVLASAEKQTATLEAGKSGAYTVVVYWAPQANDVDNQFNMEGGYEVTLNIELDATQTTGEFDSIDDQYDDGAYAKMTSGGIETPDAGEATDPFGA